MKKANLTLGAVLGLLMTILIFIPAVSIAGTFVKSRLGGPLHNLDDFSADITDMKNAVAFERRGTELKLGEKMAVVYFEKNRDKVNLNVLNAGFAPRGIVTFTRPLACEKDTNCLCLFADNVDVERTAEISWELSVLNSLCKDEIAPLKMKDCSIGTPIGNPLIKKIEGVKYTCEGGFVIERLLVMNVLIKAAPNLFSKYYEAPKRIPFQMHKEGETIILEY